ncbi:MAG: tetratricopeptide repeat protein [Candidatus Pacebacteria bacterium]|nr:tetratricopeptide repeat protein [Candidatus Paceibacterota bacterium]
MSIFENLRGRGKENGWLDTFAYYALLVSVFFLPLIAYTWVAIPASTVKLAVGSVALLVTTIVTAAALIQLQAITLPRASLFAAIWLIPLAYLLSTLFAGERTISAFGTFLTADSLAFMVVGALACTVTALLLRSQTRILGLYLTMLASATVLSILQAVLFFARSTVEATGITLPSLSLLGTLNDLAVFFGIIIILALLTLLVLPVTTLVRAVLWVALTVALFFCAIVNLAVLWWIIAVFALGCVVYSLFTAKYSDDSSMRGISLSAPMTLAVAVFFIFGPASITATPSQWAEVGELDVRPTWQSTVSIGRNALAEHAFFGTGPGSFETQWSKNIPAEIHATTFWNSDFMYGIGLIPTTVISTGLLGALAWLMFFGLLLWTGFRAFLVSSRNKESDLTRYIHMVAWFGAVYLWILTFIQVPSPALVLFAFMFTGVFLASLVRHDEAATYLTFSFKKSPRIGFLVTLTLTAVILLSAGGAYGFSTRFFAEANFQQAVRVINTEMDVDGGEQLIQKAIGLYPRDLYYRTLSEIDIYRLQQLLNEKKSPQEIKEQVEILLAQTIKNATAAIERDRDNYRNWANLANKYQLISTLGIEGSVESSVTAYQSALEKRPGAPDMLLALAALERARGNTEEARKYVEQSISVRKNYTDAIFFLAQMQLEANDTENAIRSVQAIAVFDPNNPVVFFQLGLLYYGNGDYVNAGPALMEAIRLANDYANARYFLGLTYWRLNKEKLAIDEFEKVLETNPENTEVRAIISNLKAGNPPLTMFASSTPAADIQDRQGLPINEVSPETQDEVETTSEQLSE